MQYFEHRCELNELQLVIRIRIYTYNFLLTSECARKITYRFYYNCSYFQYLRKLNNINLNLWPNSVKQRSPYEITLLHAKQLYLGKLKNLLLISVGMREIKGNLIYCLLLLIIIVHKITVCVCAQLTFIFFIYKKRTQ